MEQGGIQNEKSGSFMADIFESRFTVTGTWISAGEIGGQRPDEVEFTEIGTYSLETVQKIII